MEKYCKRQGRQMAGQYLSLEMHWSTTGKGMQQEGYKEKKQGPLIPLTSKTALRTQRHIPITVQRVSVHPPVSQQHPVCSLSPQQIFCLSGGLKPIRREVLLKAQIYKTYTPNKGSYSPTELSSPVGYCVQTASTGSEALKRLIKTNHKEKASYFYTWSKHSQLCGVNRGVKREPRKAGKLN